MDYKYLGNTGLRLSSVSFGTQTFGWNIFDKDAHELLDIYVDAGGNYLDTADLYNDGKSEKILGAWLKGRKDHDNLVIPTNPLTPLPASNWGTALRRGRVRRRGTSSKSSVRVAPWARAPTVRASPNR